MSLINIYCDESCHLPNDGKPIMAVGSIWCPVASCRRISKDIYQIKAKHNIGHDVEFKWLKVSKNKISFYLDLIEYFFDQTDLIFRGLIVSEKSKLNHEAFGQTHDEWYYKMYYQLLKPRIDETNTYHIYLDIKDTRSEGRVKKLHNILSNSFHDFNHKIIGRIQSVRSHETNLMQLTDLILGAISYINRDDGTSVWKHQLIDKIKQRSGSSLTTSTYLKENKFNLFFWNPKAVESKG